MGLLTELDTRRRAAERDYLDRIKAAARQLDAAGIPRSVMRFGEDAPDFALPTARVATIVLSSLLRSGPVVLSFYRGEWCPFCSAELDALLAAQPEMAALGASLLLISPQAPSERLATQVAEAGVRVYLLTDSKLGVALSYGLVHRVPDVLRTFYLATNPELSRDLGGHSWLIPTPADFIVGQDGRIKLAYGEPDFTLRLDPQLIVERLTDLVTRS